MSLFQNKYRTKTTRLQGWDYSSNGKHFVTICTRNSKKYFGEVKNKIMGLNELGNMAAICWQNIPSHFPFTELGAWVVMPNHVHGVIMINKPPSVETRHGKPDGLDNVVGGSTNKPSNVETRHGASLRGLDIMNYNKFGPLKSGALQTIINHYKGAVKRWCNKNNFSNFSWQSKFYDHIIRNEFEAERIHNYILNNPHKWDEDRNNPENLWM